MAVDRRLGIGIAYVAVMVTAVWKTGYALRCYACEKSSERSYADAEKFCNIASLGKCEDERSSACMAEGFQRDSSVFHVVKRCVQECPVFVNSSAQLIRCCATDACNDFVATAMDSDGFGIRRGPATVESDSKTSIPFIPATIFDPSSSLTSIPFVTSPSSSFPTSFSAFPQPPRLSSPTSTTHRITALGSNPSQMPGRSSHPPVGVRFNQHRHKHPQHRSHLDGIGLCRGSRSSTVREHVSSVLALCSTTAMLVWSNW